jgi:hypothetical protein
MTVIQSPSGVFVRGCAVGSHALKWPTTATCRAVRASVLGNRNVTGTYLPMPPPPSEDLEGIRYSKIPNAVALRCRSDKGMMTVRRRA